VPAWRLDGTPMRLVKTTEHAHCRDERCGLTAEVRALAGSHLSALPVPEVVEVGTDDQFAWLVTTALRGRAAAVLGQQPKTAAVVDVVATSCWHYMRIAEPGDCPFRTAARR